MLAPTFARNRPRGAVDRNTACAGRLTFVCLCLFFFFFSSRRRHTRCLSDWSSDVCSSDLNAFSDSGSRVILPYLRGEGIDGLDALVVSHDDRDHSGGAGSVLEAMPVGLLWSSLSPDHALLAAPAWRAPCVAGRKWLWDGVSFEFLHPSPEALERDRKSVV